jgi:hypothetical protein
MAVSLHSLRTQTFAFATKALFDTSTPRAVGVEYTRGVGRATRHRTVRAEETSKRSLEDTGGLPALSVDPFSRGRPQPAR